MSRQPIELPDALQREWDLLADRLDASPFLRPGWVLAWWRAFGAGRLELLECRRSSGLAALLPIVHRRGAVFSPTNWHTPEFAPLCSDSCAEELIAGLFARRWPWIELGWLTAEHPSLQPLEAAAREAGYDLAVQVRERSPTVSLECGWQSYERSLSGNLRRDLGRRRRRLEERGVVSLEVTDRPSALDEAFTLERLGWKGRRRSAMESRPQTAAFYREIAYWAAERGWLRLGFLRLDGRPLAFHYALQAGGAYYALKGGFDPAFSAYSPGSLMIYTTLERAFEEGLHTYELLGGDDLYKRRFTTSARVKLVVRAFAPTSLGRLARTMDKYGRPWARAALSAVRR